MSGEGRARVKDIEARLYWSKEMIDGRPGIILGHRMFYRLRDGAVLAERQLYVGHSYNSLHSITGAIPLGKGSLVFCTTRMFTDEIVGFASSLRHSIAASEMQSALAGQFGNLGPLLEKWLKAREKSALDPDPAKGKKPGLAEGPPAKEMPSPGPRSGKAE